MATPNDFEVSFGGRVFLKPSARVLAHCERYFADQFPTLASWPDPAMMAGGMQQYNLPLPPGPAKPRINRFFYPFGLSRWATFWGLMAGDDVAALMLSAYASGGPKYLPFVIKGSTDSGTTGNYNATTDLMMLPPIKLAIANGSGDATRDQNETLWLVCLVDERYERRTLRFNTSTQPTFSVPSEATSESIASAYSGRTLAGPAGSKSVGFSNQSTLSEYALYDHAAACIGMVYCRDFQPTGGKYLYRTRWRTANALAVTDRLGDETANWLPNAGSLLDSFAVGGTASSRQALLPSTVKVLFPTVTGTITPAGTTDDGKPSQYLVSVSPAVGLPVGNVAATVTTMEPAKYAADPPSGSPTNSADLTTLANQIGQDFYDSLIGCIDVVFEDIPPLNPRWATDFTIDLANQPGEKTQTRIQRDPFNGRYAIDLLLGKDLEKAATFPCDADTICEGEWLNVEPVTDISDPTCIAGTWSWSVTKLTGKDFWTRDTP